MPHWLAGMFLESPWVDGELPSLVAESGGEVVGFVGCHARRFRFDDRLLRAVCTSHLTVAPSSRGGAAGVLLLRRALTAGQDFSFSDTANDEVVRIWQALGGQLDHGRSCDWMAVLRPARWIGALGRDTLGRRLRPEQIPVGALPFRAARRRASRWAIPDPQPGVGSEEADAAAIVANLGRLAQGFRLRPAYDEAFLRHTFAQMELQFGSLVRRLVRRGERPLGWYLYAPGDRGVSRILHVDVADREADAVLGDLIGHAAAQGSAVVYGRHEPHLTRYLQEQRPILGFARRPVIHCHDPELLATVASERSLVTLLDGEWFEP